MNRRKLIQLSRNPRFLVQTSVALVVLAVIVSASISALSQKSASALKNPYFKDNNEATLDSDIDSLVSAIRNGDKRGSLVALLDFREVDFLEPEAKAASPRYAVLKTRITDSTAIDGEQRKLLLAFLDAIHGKADGRATAIETLFAFPEETRYRNEFLGDSYFANQEPEKGISAFIREGEQFSEAVYSQRSAVIALTERKEAAPLEKLINNEVFRQSLTPAEGVEAAKVLGNYEQLFYETIKLEFSLPPVSILCIALFTAAVWFVILANLGTLTKGQTLLGLLAFGLGIISTMLTLFAVIVQEHHEILPFRTTDTVLDQLLAVIAGIGLREETIKLLCYVPTLCFLLKYRSPLLVLITAALTGLGFAAWENLQYLSKSNDGFVAWSRLLTANAMHFCLTGILGFSLYQLMRKRGRGWENFLFEFLLAVVAHGLYDGFIMLPSLSEYGIVTAIILVLIAYRFLDLVRDHLPLEGQHSKFSPLGVFVLGAVMLACGIMIFTALSQPLIKAFGGFASAVGGAGVFAFAFISRLRDL